MSKSCVSIVGDPHLVRKNVDQGLQLFQTVEQMGNTTVWLGDLQDTKELIRGKILNLYFEYFKSSKLNHIVLVGNHDWFNHECDDHSLKVFSALSNVTVIDAYSHLFLIAGGKKIGFMPYMHDQEMLKTWLKKAKDDGVQMIFGHFDVKEFDYGTGRISQEGLVLSDFEDFELVISGHYHKHQVSKNLMYLGTPFSHSFGEANQSKFLAHMNVVTLELNLIPTPFPSHRDETVIVSDVNEGICDLILNPGDFYRVFLEGTHKEISEFDKERYKGINIRWVDRPTDEPDLDETIEEGGSNTQQFVKWAEDIRKLDPETVKLGLEILGGLGAK